MTTRHFKILHGEVPKDSAHGQFLLLWDIMRGLNIKRELVMDKEDQIKIQQRQGWGGYVCQLRCCRVKSMYIAKSRVQVYVASEAL
jgi:hypothetical protein